MKIVIDTKDIEAFFATLSEEYDEWYCPTNTMVLHGIVEFLEYAGKKEAVKELSSLLNDEFGERMEP